VYFLSLRALFRSQGGISEGGVRVRAQSKPRGKERLEGDPRANEGMSSLSLQEETSA